MNENKMIETMTVQETVEELRTLGMSISLDKLRDGIEQGVYPFGTCIQMKSREFDVFRVLFDKWVDERAVEKSSYIRLTASDIALQ